MTAFHALGRGCPAARPAQCQTWVVVCAVGQARQCVCATSCWQPSQRGRVPWLCRRCGPERIHLGPGCGEGFAMYGVVSSMCLPFQTLQTRRQGIWLMTCRSRSGGACCDMWQATNAVWYCADGVGSTWPGGAVWSCLFNVFARRCFYMWPIYIGLTVV